MFRKKKMSYVDAHNNAVRAYKKASTSIIFIGIFNVIGAIFYLVQINDVGDFAGQFLCLGLNMFIFSIPPVGEFLISNLPWSVIIYILLFFSFGALYAFLGVMANRGKGKYLYASLILYLIDWVFLLCCYFYLNAFLSSNSVFLMIGVHLIVTVFLFMAIYQYHKVISIEIVHKREIQKEKMTSEGENKQDDNNEK